MERRERRQMESGMTGFLFACKDVVSCPLKGTKRNDDMLGLREVMTSYMRLKN